MSLYRGGVIWRTVFVLFFALSTLGRAQSREDVLLNLDSSGAWKGESWYGVLDERLIFRGEGAKGLRLRVSAASPRHEWQPVSLYLIEGGTVPIAEVPELLKRRVAKSEILLPISAEQKRSVRLVAQGLRAGVTYWAKLFVESDKATYFYTLQIDSRAPLGLKATEVEPVPTEISPFGKWHSEGWVGSTYACIPIEYRGIADVRLLLKPPAAGVERDRPLPSGLVTPGLCSKTCGQGSLLLAFRNLPSGRYASLLDVNGEPLLVKLTLRHPWWMVPLVILLGAAFSIAAREFLSFARQRAGNESEIEKAERALALRGGSVTWDELRLRNSLRRARANNNWFGFIDLGSDLEEARAPLPERPEIATIRQTLTEAPLPIEVRRQIENRLQQVIRISSASDAAEISSRLGFLKRRAEEGFRREFMNWLDRLQSYATAKLAKIRQATTSAPPQVSTALYQALKSLESIVADAEDILLNVKDKVDLTPEQVLLLERVPAILAQIEKWTAGDLLPRRDELVKIAHCHLTAEPLPLLEEPVPAPVTVEIMQLEPELQTANALTFKVKLQPDCKPELFAFDWWVDDKTILGGQSLTYVFEKTWRSKPVVKVDVRSLDGKHSLSAVWSQSFKKTKSSRKRLERHAWIAEKGFTLVGIALASAVAISLLWVDKPFGDLNDYVSLLAVGLGVDAGVAGSGQILSRILKGLGVEKESKP